MAGYFSRSRAGLNSGALYSGNAYNASGTLIGTAGQRVVPTARPAMNPGGGVGMVASRGSGSAPVRRPMVVQQQQEQSPILQQKLAWSQKLGDAMRSKTGSLLDLEARRKSSYDASKQAVTAGMDAAARRITDTTNSRIARGVAGPDGAAITGVKKFSVHSAPDALKQLEEANYYKNQQSNVDKDYENQLAALAVEQGTTVQALKNRMNLANGPATTPKPYVRKYTPKAF